MDSDSIAMLAGMVLLLLLSAFFSATETAFSAANKIRLKSRAENGEPKANRTLALAEQYDSLLSTLLIGNNIVNITLTVVATALFTRHFPLYGAVLSTVVTTVVVLIFGEITPKTLAKESPESFAIAVTPAVRVCMVLLTPLNALFSLWRRLVCALFQTTGEEGITEEELMTMVSEAESEGGLDEHESQLIRAAIEFNDLEAGEILTPRVDVEAAPEDATMDELGALFAASGYSRLPIYSDTIDNIVGVIHEKDFYAARGRGTARIVGLVTPVIYTTATTKISSLLRTLQRTKNHMAVVVDEYGGTEGIVTLEDILEELVGEIWDEHDEVIEQFARQPDGSYLIACNANLSDLYELFAISGDCDSATVSGWVMEQIGRIPREGDHFVYENLDVTVTRVDHRRVLEIQVRLLEQVPAEQG
jgi:CBS domain containing-hemolysin-like protein